MGARLGHAIQSKETRVYVKNRTSFYYSLDNDFLVGAHSDLYLVVRIAEDLKRYPHIDVIAKKANITLSFLRRNLRHCLQNSN